MITSASLGHDGPLGRRRVRFSSPSPRPENFALSSYQDYGIVTGQVLSISPDARMDEAMGAVYRVDVAIDTTSIDHEGNPVALRAGQTATAEIVVRRRRIISLILEPIRKLQKGNISL